MLLDRIGPPGRCRGDVVMIYWFRRPRVNLFCHPYAREGQAVVCPLLRGRSPTRSVAPKQHRGPAFLSFITLTRARGPGRGLPVATGSLANAIGRAQTAPGPRFSLFYHPYARARATPWSARCYGVARQRDRSRPNSTGPPLFSLLSPLR